MIEVHPETGLHYLVCFPPRARAFGDAISMYTRFAATCPWMTKLSHPELEARMEEVASESRYFVVLWGVNAPNPPPRRKATFTRVYTEAMDDDPANLLKPHQRWLHHTQNQIAYMDGGFGHTPWMAEKLGGHVLPIGWDPIVMGRPWYGERSHRFTYLGAMAGKRHWVCPAMQGVLGADFHNASGQWGRTVLHTLNRSSGYLYLTHSDVHSFSTPRIWQAVATSAAMITEEGKDCWPMTDDMYVPIPVLTQANVMEVARNLLDLSDAELLATSKCLHEALSHFTLEHVVERYLIPASAEIIQQRRIPA